MRRPGSVRGAAASLAESTGGGIGDALGAAMRELGTKTKVATVNKALADVAARPQRLAFLDHLAAAEDYLGDSAVMEDAWR